MNNKQFNQADEVEMTILEAKRRVFPLVEMKYYKEEDLQQGHILVSIARDSECMNILQFEIFIAMFRKIAEIAHSKEQEMGCQKGWEDSALPQIEMNFDSACAGAPLYFNINEFDGDISPDDADRFVQVMENLLHQARELMKIDCFHRDRNMPPKY